MQEEFAQFWTQEMVRHFRDYCFPRFSGDGCKFDILQKFFYMRIDDDSENPARNIKVTYSCHLWASILLESIPFYLVLSAEADYYKESNIGYVQLVNGQNVHGEPQAKILAHIRGNLELEPHFDKAISEVDNPPGFGKVITLTLKGQYCDKYKTDDLVGVKLPIRGLEIEYQRGIAKEKWPRDKLAEDGRQ